MTIDIQQYCLRIKYDGPLTCNQSTLIALHENQCFQIPFDMLDTHLGITPSLEPDHIFQKLVHQNRGGGCTQLNELLALILESLGFKVKRLMARVLYRHKQDSIPPLSHKILLVEFNQEKWVCDTGFGGNGLVRPIPLDIEITDQQVNGLFKIQQDAKFGYSIVFYKDGNWLPLYAFNLNIYLPQDFKAINYFNSYYPDRVFVQNCLVTMPTPVGRKILQNQYFGTHLNGQYQTEMITTAERYHQILQSEFGIVLSDHPDFLPNPNLT